MFGKPFVSSLIDYVTKFFSPNCNALWSHLPEEIIVEILLRFPVRSLHQFKCVCKLWKTIISEGLTHQHLFFSFMSEPHKLLYFPLKPLFQNKLPPVSFSGMLKSECNIIGSCNGLLCLYYRDQRCVRLRNPSIMFKSKKSPSVSLKWTIDQCGFGYDQVNDKYKVLLVMRNKKDSSQTLTKIYTFGDDSWKTVQNSYLASIRPCSLSGELASGNLNWIVKKRDVSSHQTRILSFNLETETYKELLLPQEDGDEVYGYTLYVLNNCLGVCHVSNETNWVAWLMEYGVVDSWTKFMTIPYDKFNNQPCFPMFISGNGLVLLMNKHTTQFVLYNINSGQLINSLESTNTIRINLHICCESLVSVP